MYFIFGMASLGVLIGLFVAWSASPIAQIALPLIFGIIGGASGFSVTTMDVTKPNNVSKLKLLGQSLAAFSLACIVGVVVGIAIRPTLNAFDSPRHNIELAGDKKPETMIKQIVLRKKLELVGASEDEIASLLSHIEASGDVKSFEAWFGKLDIDSAVGLLTPQSGTLLTPPSGTRLPPRGALFPMQRDAPGTNSN